MHSPANVIISDIVVLRAEDEVKLSTRGPLQVTMAEGSDRSMLCILNSDTYLLFTHALQWYHRQKFADHKEVQLSEVARLTEAANPEHHYFNFSLDENFFKITFSLTNGK